MTLTHHRASRLVTLTLALASCATAFAQGDTPAAKPTDTKPAHSSDGAHEPDLTQTVFLKYATQRNDLNDVSTAVRNMTQRIKLYATPEQNAITMSGTAEELQTAQAVISSLDRPDKQYRLTYTITDLDNGKRIGVQHFTLIAVAGEKVDFKQGSKIPIATGSYGPPPSSATNTQFQYLDIGLEIEASVATTADGISLRTKVSQSSLAEDKSAAFGTADPIIRQTNFEGTATLVAGKPLVLGSLDAPGSTRHQEIEVVSELIH